MRTNRPISLQNKAGFTLMELLVVIAIIAILIGLLLPAVQKVREAAARLSCINKLSQIGLAVKNYESAFNHYPAAIEYYKGNAGVMEHNWITSILPYMEYENLIKKYNKNKPWDDKTENHVVTGEIINALLCPSSATGYNLKSDGTSNAISPGRSDYATPQWVSIEFNKTYPNLLNSNNAGVLKGAITYDPGTTGQNFTGQPTQSIKDTSKTLLVVEDTGRPKHFIVGKKDANFNYSNYNEGCNNAPIQLSGLVGGSGWAAPQNGVPLHGFNNQGSTCPGLCVINCTNNNEAYSFHTGGMNAVFADRSVRFIKENIQPKIYAFLIIADKEGNIINDNDF